jgi:catechol 2,3-dioxygenase-like lactoylglutathione lyase family enzyme
MISNEKSFFHTGLTVSNIEEAKAFFSQVFSLPVTSERDLSGEYLAKMLNYSEEMTARIVMLQTGDETFIELVEYQTSSGALPEISTISQITKTGSPHFAFFVNDLLQFHKEFVPKYLDPIGNEFNIIPGGPFQGGLIQFYHSTFGCLIEIIEKPK